VSPLSIGHDTAEPPQRRGKRKELWKNNEEAAILDLPNPV